jgi:hypothetical protein
MQAEAIAVKAVAVAYAAAVAAAFAAAFVFRQSHIALTLEELAAGEPFMPLR